MPELPMLQRRRVVIDFLTEFPLSIQPEMMAKIMQDYIKLNRFNAALTDVQVSVYPENTKIVQHPISLSSNLNDIKS